jgi:hypothetical protein
MGSLCTINSFYALEFDLINPTRARSRTEKPKILIFGLGSRVRPPVVVPTIVDGVIGFEKIGVRLSILRPLEGESAAEGRESAVI